MCGKKADIDNSDMLITGEFQNHKIYFDNVYAYCDPKWKGIMLDFEGKKVISDTKSEPIDFEMFITEKMKLHGQVYSLEVNKEINLPNVNIGFLVKQPDDTWLWNLGSPPNKFMITKFSQKIGDVIEGNIDIKLACSNEDCGWLKGHFSCIVESKK